MFFVSSYTSLSDFILQWRMFYVQQLAHKYSHAVTAFLHFSISTEFQFYFVFSYSIPTWTKQKNPKRKKELNTAYLFPHSISLIKFFQNNYAKHPQLCIPELVRPKWSFDFTYNKKYKIFLNQLLSKIEHMLWKKWNPKNSSKAEVTLQQVESMVNFFQCWSL